MERSVNADGTNINVDEVMKVTGNHSYRGSVNLTFISNILYTLHSALKLTEPL